MDALALRPRRRKARHEQQAHSRHGGRHAALATAREPSRRDHLPCQVRHLDEIDWETIRWPGETGKMLFHPTPERPTAPNAGVLRIAPGGWHPEHYHGFAQLWYILKGEFVIDGKLCTPGTMLYHPDPHFEGVFDTKTGGEILIVQYPGSSTGERPIYAGRFNMAERKALAEERVDL
jgi:mannose-6-phosphate isomerase-like protein (cupin superfamily)